MHTFTDYDTITVGRVNIAREVPWDGMLPMDEGLSRGAILRPLLHCNELYDSLISIV